MIRIKLNDYSSTLYIEQMPPKLGSFLIMDLDLPINGAVANYNAKFPTRNPKLCNNWIFI